MAILHSFAVAGPHREHWLTSHSAPEGSRKRSKGIARPAVLDPRVKQNRQARQIGKPELTADVNCAKWQHARSYCSDAEPGHDGRGDRSNTSADEDFRPGHACRVKELPGHRTYAAGLGERDKRQGLARAMLPTWCSKPANFLFRKEFPVAPPGMQANDYRVEFPPVVALKQVT